MQQIVDNGVFVIPLYHGTSSAFLPSIESYGLGMVNPLEQYGAISLLRSLYTMCNDIFDNDPAWRECKLVIQWMVDQETFKLGGNFQHGKTYLSPSRASACGYALTNRFGSEMISNVHKLYNFLGEQHPQALQECGLYDHPLMSLFKLEHKPVVVIARNVPVSFVLSEGGDPPDKAIEILQGIYPLLMEQEDGSVVNINFRLRLPLSPGSFSVEYINDGEKNPFNW